MVAGNSRLPRQHAARAFASLPMQASCKCIVLAGILFIALVWPVPLCDNVGAACG